MNYKKYVYVFISLITFSLLSYASCLEKFEQWLQNNALHPAREHLTEYVRRFFCLSLSNTQELVDDGSITMSELMSSALWHDWDSRFHEDLLRHDQAGEWRTEFEVKRKMHIKQILPLMEQILIEANISNNVKAQIPQSKHEELNFSK